MYHTLYFMKVTSMCAISIIFELAFFIFPLTEELTHEHFIIFLKQAGQIDFGK